MSENEKNNCNKFGLYVSFFVVMSLVLAVMNVLFGCTMSFQNISTHGTATDLVDENQAGPDIKTALQVPLNPLP